MKKPHAKYIVNMISMRLEYKHYINLTSDQINRLYYFIEKYFSDDDYSNVSDQLRIGIREKLKTFGIPTKLANLESWKWSD